MCGRFTMAGSTAELTEQLQLPAPGQLPGRFNIAPTQNVTVVRSSGKTGAAWDIMRWGLVPPWKRTVIPCKPLINVRSETVASKPSLRQAFARRRCLVPASGFFEWKQGERGREPWYFCLRNPQLFAFAAIWETLPVPEQETKRPAVRAAGTATSDCILNAARPSRGGGNTQGHSSIIASCAILTTAANELVAPVHLRMPVILGPQDWQPWLEAGCDTSALLALLRPFPVEEMQGYPVSRRVNKVESGGAELIWPVSQESQLKMFLQQNGMLI